jgi:hypothetical protein
LLSQISQRFLFLVRFPGGFGGVSYVRLW